MAPHLLALVEQELHPHADAQQRHARGDGVEQRPLKARPPQIRRRIPERADAGQHDPGRPGSSPGSVTIRAGAPGRLQRLVDVAQVPHAIVNDDDRP